MVLRAKQRTRSTQATALVFDLRNFTKLYRKLGKQSQRNLIFDMMKEIHLKIFAYLYEQSGVGEDFFAFNDTGDGYLITFFNAEHSLSCVLCACFIRDFLKPLIERYNQELHLAGYDLKYKFGIGVHSSHIRLIPITYDPPSGELIRKTIIIGNAANSAARVEAATKMFADADLLITGYTREEAKKECSRSVKHLFNKGGPYVKKIAERLDIGDGQRGGHNLYSVSDAFYEKYKEITSGKTQPVK